MLETSSTEKWIYFLLQISEKDVKFLQTLGQGASGVVQKAFWPSKAEFVAVKKISILEREKRHQLMNDIKALCNVPDVPGLIRFHGAYHCADKGQVAVALEYMDGGSLADMCQKKGRIDEDMLASITYKVLQGLSYLHAHHTVHRDIKPANILLSTNGEAKVSDFGISAFVDNTLAQCHTFLGTVTYMSPERIDGQPYSFPADLWALGLTLLECVTGRYPYDASKGTMQLMIQLMEDECPLPESEEIVSHSLRDFIQRCMQKNPLKRPTAVELLRHPFLAKATGVNLRAQMRCMFVPEAKLQDAALIISNKFYNNLSYNWSESDVTASFYDEDVRFSSGPAAAVPGSTPTQEFRGQYTVAAQFHDISRQIGSRASFMVNFRKMKFKEHGDSYLLHSFHNVSIQERSTHSISDEIGAYEESMVVEITSIDSLMPGSGFRIVRQDIRWVKALRPANSTNQASLKAPASPSGKCRQQ